jgi:hypothetical protein
MKSLQNTPESCDITIKIGPQEYKAHGFVLMARCEFFRAMINFDKAENEIVL